MERKKNTVKFSVLIPVYNAGKYLEDCIESVLNQSYKNFEIILVDDGSTDNSLNICKRYTDDLKIKTITQKNKGQFFARQRALSEAKGEYCIFLDSDDYWHSNLLLKVHETIKTYDSDLVIFRYTKVSDNGEVLFTSPSTFENHTLFDVSNKEELFKVMSNSFDLNNLVCKAFRRNIVNKDFFKYYNNIRIRNGEDLLQSLSLISNANTICYVNQTLYFYRYNTSSVSNTLNINILNDITTVRKSLLKYMTVHHCDSEENKRELYTFYLKILLKNLHVVYLSNHKFYEKKQALEAIKKEDFYIQAIKYVKLRNLNSKEILRFLLYRSNLTALFLLESIMESGRKFK